jgi:hypothetical protein
MLRIRYVIAPCLALLLAMPAAGQDFVEITPDSEAALERGLAWLAANQGSSGNWESNDLGLVSLGALAFLAAGNAPGRGRYGKETARAIDYVLTHAKPSGLLNTRDSHFDMYNHGLSTFVLGQTLGMTTGSDRRLREAMDRALKLIARTQAEDGGWNYEARRTERGSDLSLAVMQAKALRGAVDSGLDVPPEVIDLAIRSVREHYAPAGDRNASEAKQMQMAGQFCYGKGGNGGTIAMAAAGVVCLQEFGQYDDWRIAKNMDVIAAEIKTLPQPQQVKPEGKMPFDAYTLYYVGQALYQVNGSYWRENYPRLRDLLVAGQDRNAKKNEDFGSWDDRGFKGESHVGGKPGKLYGTSVACFLLAIPNRYLPILQEGKIESFRQKQGLQ